MSDTSTPTPRSRRRVPSDRAPRDWRFWVGGTGRVLLVVGVLMFGFVAYQLWGTGIEYEQHQNSLEREFNDRLDELSTSPLVVTTAAQSTGSTNTATSSTPGTSTAGASGPTTSPTTSPPAPGPASSPSR